MSNHYDPKDEPYKSHGVAVKDKIAGELVAIRLDLEFFTNEIRGTLEPFKPATINEMQVKLKDFGSRIAKLQETLMEEAPAHEHLKESLDDKYKDIVD